MKDTPDVYTSGAVASDEDIRAPFFSQGAGFETNAPSTEVDPEERESRGGPSCSHTIAPSPVQ